MILLLAPLIVATTASPLLAGFLQLDEGLCRRWAISGRWVYPVGDALDYRRGGPAGEPPFAATRNVRRGGARHTGADLSNRRGGDAVRAASHGVVVAATHLGNGYGHHVVMAHRMPEGELVYSIYAHLESGSLTVAQGEAVALGQVLGRVGRSGVATSPHLHFELRRPRHPGDRWEKSEALDPIAFVAARLPTRDRDSTWAGPYVAWAERGGLISPGEPAHSKVVRARWRRTLASALCAVDAFLAGPPSALRAPLAADPDTLRPITWSEVAADIERARSLGMCLPPGGPPESERRAACRLRLEHEAPSRQLERIAQRGGGPTLAELTLLLSDLAGD